MYASENFKSKEKALKEAIAAGRIIPSSRHQGHSQHLPTVDCCSRRTVVPRGTSIGTAEVQVVDGAIVKAK